MKDLIEMFDTDPVSNGIDFLSADQIQDVISEPVQSSFEQLLDVLVESDNFYDKYREFC